MIILNKMDLVSSKEAWAVRTRIRGMNKSAKLFPTVQSKIKTDVRLTRPLAIFTHTRAPATTACLAGIAP